MLSKGVLVTAEFCHDEAEGAQELFVSLLWLNVAVDFNFLLSEVTCELILRADPSLQRSDGDTQLLVALQSVFAHWLDG